MKKQKACTVSNLDEEKRYRLLNEAVNGIRDFALIILDSDGIILTWNRGAERINGYTESDILGKHFSIFYTQKDQEKSHPEEELKIAKAEGHHEEEGWRIRKNGTKFWANILISRLKDEAGGLQGFSVIIRDLTARRQVEDSLRASEERFRALVEGVKDYAIFLLDPQGIVATWNEGAQRLKGYTPEEIIGKHFSVFYPEEVLEDGNVDWELEEAAVTGRFEDEGWRVRKDGTRFWANVVITALRDSKGRISGFSKVTRDLTERKRAEERLRRANESLEKRVAKRTEELSKAKEELERALISRDEFLSVASHELKTPITSLKLQVQSLRSKIDLAKGQSPSPEKMVNVLEVVLRQTNRLVNLVEDLLDVARIQLGKLSFRYENINLSDLIQDILTQWEESLASAGCSITRNISEGIFGYVDSYRYEQVLANLLSNVIKYAPGKPIEVSLKVVEQSAVLKVKDSGPGIESVNQVKIFERYERANSIYGVSGLGLGLFISKAIAEAHNGTITVESELGEGTTFTLKVPLNIKNIRVLEN